MNKILVLTTLATGAGWALLQYNNFNEESVDSTSYVGTVETGHSVGNSNLKARSKKALSLPSPLCFSPKPGQGHVYNLKLREASVLSTSLLSDEFRLQEGDVGNSVKSVMNLQASMQLR